jgi:hypothetical protein
MQLRTRRDAWSKRLKKLDLSAFQLPSARLNQRVGALSLIRVSCFLQLLPKLDMVVDFAVEK